MQAKAASLLAQLKAKTKNTILSTCNMRSHPPNSTLHNLHLAGDCSGLDRADADMSHTDFGPNYNYKDQARISVLGKEFFWQ